MVPPEIRIEFVKIDAQGHDLSVAQGCGSQLSRVEHIMLECQVQTCPFSTLRRSRKAVRLPV